MVRLSADREAGVDPYPCQIRYPTTMIQNFGGNGLSYYGVWFELPQADLPHGLNPWGVV